MDKQYLMSWIKTSWWQMGLIVIGLIMMGGGIMAAQSQTLGEELVIVDPVPETSVPTAARPSIDVEGAVEKPGVYQLTHGSRVADAIIAAGGMSATADRSWVARFINQAEIVRDGGKIYIPELGEQIETSDKIQGTSVGEIISINMASESELDGLWGIGPARAKTIIENRPYISVDELVTKAKIPQDVMDANQGKIGL